MSNGIRLTGMATGLDTDTTVKQLMKSYQTRMDKMNQNKQIVQWRQDMFRDIMGSINTLKSTYFDVLKPDKNMLSRNSYTGFDVKTTDFTTGNASTAVGITAGTAAVAGNYKIEVTQLAAGASMTSSSKVQTAASADATSSTTLADMGITATTMNVTYNNGSGAVTKEIALTADMTLSDLASKITSGTSNGVVARFSDLSGKFSIQTSSTGSGTSVSIDNADISTKLNLASSAGKDLNATITAPGQAAVSVVKSSNAFSADGINYRFNSVGTVNANVSLNVDKPFEKIKEFIGKYNEMIEEISDKIEEKTQRTYLPLTDEQKKAMSEDDIKVWEKKAKQGLLRSDSMLSGMLNSMRSAFFDTVKDAGISLTDIGLSTSKDTTERGKIVIDEAKLKSALQTNGDQIANLFAKTSTSKPTYNPDYSQTDRATRMSEEGIFQRVNDILLDYTRTTRNNAGKKGLLVEKAGIKGDFSEYNNLLTKDLKVKQEAIDAFAEKMAVKENRYYSQFAKLESAMNSLNSQSSWLSQQLSSMS